MPMLKNGTQINENCSVERLIGEGTFSEVYRIRHRYLGRQAMKILKMACVDEKEIQDRLEEAALLSSLGHPNIIRVFDANTIIIDQDQHAYLTMEYMPAGNLDEFWAQKNFLPIPLAMIMDIFLQILQGLSVAHRSQPPIIHRDINLNNILLGFNGQHLRAVLCDFGFARRVNPLTLMASAKGTLPFKAPELFENEKLDSCAADVWSVACCMYLLLTNHFPYHIDHIMPQMNVPEFLEAYTPAGKINVDVFPELEVVLYNSLQLNPHSRTPDAMTFHQMLIDCIQVQVHKEKGPIDDKGKTRITKKQNPADLVKQAEALARFPGKLHLAADLLAAAIRQDPGLEKEFSYRLSLWRKGLTA